MTGVTLHTGLTSHSHVRYKKIYGVVSPQGGGTACLAPWPRRGQHMTTLISQKMFIKAFRNSQFPHKSVNLLFMNTNVKNQLTFKQTQCVLCERMHPLICTRWQAHNHVPSADPYFESPAHIWRSVAGSALICSWRGGSHHPGPYILLAVQEGVAAWHRSSFGPDSSVVVFSLAADAV